jgi:hypothetical protein
VIEVIRITLHKKGIEPAQHISMDDVEMAYVEVNNADTNQMPRHQGVQIGSSTTINYCPHGWVIIEGDKIFIKPHDGKGNPIPGSETFMKF